MLKPAASPTQVPRYARDDMGKSSRRAKNLEIRVLKPKNSATASQVLRCGKLGSVDECVEFSERVVKRSLERCTGRMVRQNEAESRPENASVGARVEHGDSQTGGRDAVAM